MEKEILKSILYSSFAIFYEDSNFAIDNSTSEMIENDIETVKRYFEEGSFQRKNLLEKMLPAQQNWHTHRPALMISRRVYPPVNIPKE